MASYLGALIEHEIKPQPSVTGLARVVPRDAITPTVPSEHELDELQWGQKLSGPSKFAIGSSSSQTPAELESSNPPTPKQNQVVDAIIQSATTPYMNKWRLAAAAVMFFLLGLNDGATGALIPYLEKSYGIGYAIVSLIFVTNAVGFIVAAAVTQMVDTRWGRSKSYIMATTMMSIGYIALVCAPPFPIVVVAFFSLGSGMGLFLAMTNAFIVNLLNGTVILGFMHGLYGVSGSLLPTAIESLKSVRLVRPWRL